MEGSRRKKKSIKNIKRRQETCNYSIFGPKSSLCNYTTLIMNTLLPSTLRFTIYTPPFFTRNFNPNFSAVAILETIFSLSLFLIKFWEQVLSKIFQEFRRISEKSKHFVVRSIKTKEKKNTPQLFSIEIQIQIQIQKKERHVEIKIRKKKNDNNLSNVFARLPRLFSSATKVVPLRQRFEFVRREIADIHQGPLPSFPPPSSWSLGTKEGKKRERETRIFLPRLRTTDERHNELWINEKKKEKEKSIVIERA